ncbi:MAG: tyrosine-type recombinase/integrase [Planctomycetota bacterium]|nr:tyrosine-type recombinase/integrase [Planctomycetota bacterium]
MASVQGKRVQWIDPATRKRKTKTLGSPALAKRFASDRETEADLVKGRFLDPRSIELGKQQWTPITDAVEEYSQELSKRRVSEVHRKETIRLIEKLSEACKYQTIGEIDTRTLDSFLKGVVRQGLSARTHNAYLRAIGAFCRWLLGFQRIDRDPTTAIRLMDESKDKRQSSRAMTFSEVEALLRVAGPRRLYYLFRFRTGLRTKECGRLLWDDIDLTERVLRLRAETTKNGKADLLPLADDLHHELSQVLAVPVTSVFGTTPSQRTWQRDLERACIRYDKLEGRADMKCTRKTFDADLFRAGVDPVIVSLLMRHSLQGGLALTLGPYGDPAALLDRNREAIARLGRWHRGQRARLAVA